MDKDEIEKLAKAFAEKAAFRVPYDGSNSFYDTNHFNWAVEAFKAGYAAATPVKEDKGGLMYNPKNGEWYHPTPFPSQRPKQPTHAKELEGKDIGQIAIDKFEKLPLGVQTTLKKADWCVGFCHGLKYAAAQHAIAFAEWIEDNDYKRGAENKQYVVMGFHIKDKTPNEQGERCLHTGKINQGHHPDQPSYCDECGEEL